MSREEWLSKTHSEDRSPAVKYTVQGGETVELERLAIQVRRFDDQGFNDSMIRDSTIRRLGIQRFTMSD
jgi:hypothetical protein